MISSTLSGTLVPCFAFISETGIMPSAVTSPAWTEPLKSNRMSFMETASIPCCPGSDRGCVADGLLHEVAAGATNHMLDQDRLERLDIADLVKLEQRFKAGEFGGESTAE